MFGSRAAFAALCIYLASQAFQIPVLALGPSWAVWPVLSDFAVGLMLVAWLSGARQLAIQHRANKAIYRAFGLVVIAVCLAFLLSMLRAMVFTLDDTERAASFGIFQIYRLLQFAIVLRVTAGIALTPRRVRIMSRLVEIAFVAAFLGILGTYTGFLPTPTLVSHLPSDIDSAGPWVTMSNGQWHEAGTISHNHSYVSVQLLMLAALALCLRGPRRGPAWDALFLSLAGAGVFLTGSRAGMAGAVFFVAAMLIRKPASLALAAAGFALLSVTVSTPFGEPGSEIGATSERHLTLRYANDPENLSGRAIIWQESLELLQDEPSRWIIGVGPGFIAQSGNNAHMLYLHIIIEGGIIGLLIFGSAVSIIIRALRRFELREKPILWATVALLITSLTQETLYPVPAMGHFLGFYLCAVALAVSVGATIRGAAELEAARRAASPSPVLTTAGSRGVG